MSENFKSVTEFYQFVCRSIDNNELASTGKISIAENDKKDEVYLGTIHRAKGKEFQNVVYFNLCKTGRSSEKIGEEEERRVTYVGATRPKDSLLVTFPSTKSSIFLPEIALNPQFKGITDEDLERRSVSTKLRHKKERTKVTQLEFRKDKLLIRFDQLNETQSTKKPDLLMRLTWMIMNWRISKIQEKIESLDKRIRKHNETVIDPLLIALADLEEETNIRKAITPTSA